ncbi:hypothetical protein LTS18_003447, partial [Coniosporium uncinatum]
MSSASTISLGLNVLQVLQNELQSRETSKTGLGLGSRFQNVEERLKNLDAVSRNSRVWRPQHSVAPIAAPVKKPISRKDWEWNNGVSRKDGRKRGEKHMLNPTADMQEFEWKVHEFFPRTVGEFQALRHDGEGVRDLLEFYGVHPAGIGLDVFREGEGNESDESYYSGETRRMRVKERRQKSRLSLRDVENNVELCLEELAI